jgi:hypothetical protein
MSQPEYRHAPATRDLSPRDADAVRMAQSIKERKERERLAREAAKNQSVR